MKKNAERTISRPLPKTGTARMRLLACTFWACTGLVACGGGGGAEGGSSPPITPPVTNTPPSVSVVANQSVVEGVLVFLGGVGVDAQGAVTYQWAQLSGPTVALSNTAHPAPSFTAPLVAQDTVLQFRLIVTDTAGATASATTAVTVRDAPPPSASITTQVLAGQGMQAAGFVPGTVYAEVTAPVIGRNGHVAFRGRADTSVSPIGQGSNVVWAGQPDQLVPIVVEGDTIPGLPSDVVYGGSSIAGPYITASGNVMLLASLKGTVAPADRGMALLAYVGGSMKKVLRVGDPAPGLPGKTVTAMTTPVFSDAGAVFSNGVNTAVWHWNLSSTSLLAAAGQATGLYPNCQFSSFQGWRINAQGDVVVGAILASTVTGNTACPAHAVFMWRNGVMTAVMDSLQPIPNVPGSQFYLATQPTNQPFLGGIQLTDAGGLLFQATSKPGNLYSVWYQPLASTPRLIALDGETLPPAFNTPMVVGAVSINESGAVVASVKEGNSAGPLAILVGQARATLPYGNLAAPGPTQLSMLARIGGQPPGFPATATYVSLGALLNNVGEVMVPAIVQDGLSVTNQTMLYDANGAGRSILASGQQIDFAGAARPLNTMYLAAGFSDNKRAISLGKLDGTYEVILLTTY